MSGAQLELFGEVVGVARDAQEAHKVLRDYTERANISRSALDDAAMLPDGYAAKLLSEPPRKGLGFGIGSFWSIVDALGLAIAFVKDKRRTSRFTKIPKRDIKRMPKINGEPDLSLHWRNAKAACMATEMVKKSRIVLSSKGGKARVNSMTPEQLSAANRRAANMRWSAHRKRMRELRQLLNSQ